tara:strand:- start:268 stop:1425 length:1158 start_codon:yes stop_codon:yes gene_type:complete
MNNGKVNTQKSEVIKDTQPVEKPIEKTVEEPKVDAIPVAKVDAIPVAKEVPDESQENLPNADIVPVEPQTKENTETIITHIVDTFQNSEDIGEALRRLATEIPYDILLNFFDKFLAIIEGVLEKVQNTLGVELEFKDPDKAMEEIKENLPKIKFRVLLTGILLKELLQDPEIMQVWTEFIEIFQNKFFQPFMIATLATLQEYEPQIEAQGEKMEKIFSKVVNRTGDAVSDAFGNVIAGIPYIGTVVAGIGAADNLAKVIIANVDGWGELFLETSYRLSVTLKKIAPNGLMALDGTIDMVINAYNTYLAVKNTLDRYNALAQGIKFNPDEGYNTDKLTNMIMNSAEKSGTLPDQVPPKVIEEPKVVEEPKTDEKKELKKSHDKPVQ